MYSQKVRILNEGPGAQSEFEIAPVNPLPQSFMRTYLPAPRNARAVRRDRNASFQGTETRKPVEQYTREPTNSKTKAFSLVECVNLSYTFSRSCPESAKRALPLPKLASSPQKGQKLLCVEMPLCDSALARDIFLSSVTIIIAQKHQRLANHGAQHLPFSPHLH